MGLVRRRSDRFSASIWPGFVDAMTALLLVLMFVLSIFMIVQFMLRETITGQEHELDTLHSDIAQLADALGLERRKSEALNAEIGTLNATLDRSRETAEAQAAQIVALAAQVSDQQDALGEAETAIAGFEERVAALLLERDTLASGQAALEGERDALQTALAAARGEIDAQSEAARLAAAKRQALEALIADLQAESAATGEDLASQTARADALQAQISEQEASRLTEAAAAEALRKRLEGAEDELTAMTLALEEQRRKAEDTLTLLAAAQSAEQDLDRQLAAAEAARLAAERSAEEQLGAAEERAVLLAAAHAQLAQEEAKSAESQRSIALLNENVTALRTQLGALQDLLDAADARDAEAQVEIQSLGNRLNTALAQVASEERKRAELEEAERRRLEEEKARLEAEAKDLKNYRSEFFGRLRNVLGGREGVRIEGDRFVFSSEVLFEPGSAEISAEGQAQIARVASILSEVSADIPGDIDWVIRVDGHTDNQPLSGAGAYRSNWELSQARALAVVRYMTEALGFPPNRLAATGFGEFQPVDPADTPEAWARNRRIELKLTER
ncbi:peptidoglycan -binding protein [Tropicimonas sp.]|uniref:peptidoglycan -binding protein n=1 Tax=Tropicimonas sp. TaxID=2067044 RepID=UPI003A8B94F2